MLSDTNFPSSSRFLVQERHFLFKLILTSRLPPDSTRRIRPITAITTTSRKWPLPSRPLKPCVAFAVLKKLLSFSRSIRNLLLVSVKKPSWLSFWPETIFPRRMRSKSFLVPSCPVIRTSLYATCNFFLSDCKRNNLSSTPILTMNHHGSVSVLVPFFVWLSSSPTMPVRWHPSSSTTCSWRLVNPFLWLPTSHMPTSLVRLSSAWHAATMSSELDLRRNSRMSTRLWIC
mmetsp:Transcript_30315/g.44832  ORF Transcript_30315/g.44832 Transcript_30315/m.44832 type:complete len:230 (+) Transcript_30315:435-1124(+)